MIIYIVKIRFLITKNSVIEIQNLVVNHQLQPIKLNSESHKMVWFPVSYNLAFLFNVGHGFSLCNVGKIWAMLVWHLQQQVIIKKLPKSVQSRYCSPVIYFVPQVLRQNCTGFLHGQSCLESLKHHCTRFLPV